MGKLRRLEVTEVIDSIELDGLEVIKAADGLSQIGEKYPDSFLVFEERDLLFGCLKILNLRLETDEELAERQRKHDANLKKRKTKSEKNKKLRIERLKKELARLEKQVNE